MSKMIDDLWNVFNALRRDLDTFGKILLEISCPPKKPQNLPPPPGLPGFPSGPMNDPRGPMMPLCGAGRGCEPTRSFPPPSLPSSDGGKFRELRPQMLEELKRLKGIIKMNDEPLNTTVN